MSRMSRETKLIFFALAFISFIQNVLMASNPAIELINTEVFPDKGLSLVQAVSQSSFFILVVVSMISATAISRGLMTKKGAITMSDVFRKREE